MLKRVENDLFDLLAYLEGPTAAEGVFEDRAGNVKRRFRAELIGEPAGDGLVLDEKFHFDDGELQTRVWTMQRGADQRTFSGTCGDAISDASGCFEPGRARLSSTLRIPFRNSSIALQFDDVFYEMEARIVLNRSTVSKWGFRIGQVVMVLRKP